MTSIPEKPATRTEMLERIRLSLAMAIPGVNHEVDLREVAGRVALVVDTLAYGREVVAEGQGISTPASAWDAVKGRLNESLEALDRRLEGLGIVPIGRRFEARTTTIRTKQVHHVCPHIGKDWGDHVRYIFVPEGRPPRDHRLLERIRVLVEDGIRSCDGRGTLGEIQYLLRTAT